MLALQFMVAFAQFNKTAREFEASPTHLNLEGLSFAITTLLTYYEAGLNVNEQYLDSVADTISGQLYELIAIPSLSTMYMPELLDLIILTSEARRKRSES